MLWDLKEPSRRKGLFGRRHDYFQGGGGSLRLLMKIEDRQLNATTLSPSP